jgi:hypothetical protein
MSRHFSLRALFWLLIFVFWALSALAEVSTIWVSRYDGCIDEVKDMAVDKLGNVYVTGTSDNQYGTIKYYPNGNTAWVRRELHGCASAIAVDNSGNVYVTGASDGDYATVKYDPEGNQLWVSTYDGPPDEEGYQDGASAIAVDNSGNVYVTGASGGCNGNPYDYATVKYAPNGNELWARRYDGPGDWMDIANAIAVDGSGNVYITGCSFAEMHYDYATIKYDTDGEQLWVKSYDGGAEDYNHDYATAIAVDGSGNVYVTGYSSNNTFTFDYATVKYAPNGNELWVERYNGPTDNGSSNDVATAIAVDGSGNVYVTGWSMGPDCPPHGYSWYDYLTIKYDPNGSELWVESYNGLGNSAEYPGANDYAYDIALDSSGDVYVTGTSTGDQYSEDWDAIYIYDYATVRYSSLDGQELWVERYNGEANDRDVASAITVDDSKNVYVTGSSMGNGADLDYVTIKYFDSTIRPTPTCK